MNSGKYIKKISSKEERKKMRERREFFLRRDGKGTKSAKKNIS
jgi:hypothetical protein